MELAEETRANRAISIWKASRVPERHSKFLASSNKNQHWGYVLARLRQVVADNGIALLNGTRGGGKTQLAVECMRDACKNIQSCKYVRSREIGLIVRGTYAGKTSELDAIESICRPHLLVIDEVQEKPDTEFEWRNLTLILDKRYGDMKPTILVSNWKADSIGEILPDSILDRMNECGGMIEVNIPSFRR